MLGRMAFAAGYCTGEPANRKWGNFGYLGALGLYTTAIAVALHKLGIISKPLCC